MRRVVWFSCGAASACTAYFVIDKYSHDNVHVVYCNTLASKHPDNVRFLQDVGDWLNHEIEIISSDKYSDVDDVFEKTRYMAGISGARCTLELKRLPRVEYQEYDDIHYFGLTSDESRRIKRFEENNPDLDIEWILRDNGIKKQDCLDLIEYCGIALPVMYSLGFKNNNCIGCVKATSAKYWDRTRTLFPIVFEKRAKQSRKLGVRLTRYKGKRIFLDELPHLEAVREEPPEEDIECGPICLTEKYND